MLNMMTINLAKGHFNSIMGHDSLRVDFTDFELPNCRYVYRAKEREANLPSISEAYDTMIEAEYTGSEIIDLLIELYFPLRFFRVGIFEKMPLCLGFIGGRGGGKSCSGAIVAVCDFLIRGLPVWSNVPIQVRVTYKDCEKIFSSIDINQLDMLDLKAGYQGGLVFVDEVNMTAAESTRYSSEANRKFSYVMQQIRKRMISVCWTAQGWSTVDNRLKFQSDFVVAARDVIFEKKHHKTNGLGDRSLWRCHDLSGLTGKYDYDFELKHRYLSDYIVWKGLCWMTPWWLCYDTNKLQSDDYIGNYRAEVRRQRRNEKYGMIEAPDGTYIQESTDTLREYVYEILENNPPEKIKCQQVYDCLNVDVHDKAITTEIGMIFSEAGYERKGDVKSGRYWQKREVKENAAIT